MDPAHAFDYVLDAYVQRKFIEPVSDGKEAAASEKVYAINLSKRPALEYYKNNCVSAMVPAAFTALAVLEQDAFQFSGSDIYDGYRFLQEFFINEFSHDADKTAEFCVHKNIKAFIDDAILSPHPTLPDTYNLTSAGFRKLKLFSAFLTTYFESYWVALNFFNRYPKNFIEAKDRIKKVHSTANRFYKKKEIERSEAISTINFKNAIDYFTAHGIRGSEDEEPIAFYMWRIQRYLELLRS
jgi:glycerol-3-phosphate O-acyltransferase